MAWAAALAGAALGYMGDRQQAKAAKGAGNVELTNRTLPWEPSDAYRKFGMEHAYNLMGGGWDERQVPFGPGGQQTRTQRTPTGIPVPGAPSGGSDMVQRPDGRMVPTGGGRPARPGRGGGGGGGTPGFSGVSPETSRLLGDMTGRAEGGHELYDPSNAFVRNLLAGGEPNAYRAEAFRDLDEFNDPDLDRFKAMLFAGEMPGTLAGAGVGLGGTGRSSSGIGGGGGGGGGANQADLVGVRQYLADILAGKDLEAENPYRQSMIDATTRDITRKFKEETIPGINAEYTGAGRFGGKLYSDTLAKSAREFTGELGDTIGGINYSEYEARKADQANAAGLGTQYDLGVMDQAASAGASRAASAAAAEAARRDSEDRMSLARMGALQDAIGMGVGMRQFGLGGMSSLAGLYSDDQMGALGLVPELSGLDIRDLSAAGGLSLGADQNRIGMEDIRQRGRDAAASRGIARSAQDWEKERYFREEPWLNSMRYMDLINAASGPYGVERTSGFDKRTQAPYAANPWGNALAGGLAGWYGAGGNNYLGSQPGRG